MLTVKNGHLLCPVCGASTTQMVLPDSRGENIPVYCRRCRNRFNVNIDSGQCSSSPSP